MPHVHLFIKSFLSLTHMREKPSMQKVAWKEISLKSFFRDTARALSHTDIHAPHTQKKLWLEKQNNTLSELIISIRSQWAAQRRQISWLSSCERYIPGFLFSLPLSSRFLARRPFVIFLPQRLPNWICLIKHSSNCHVRSESLYDQQRR